MNEETAAGVLGTEQPTVRVSGFLLLLFSINVFVVVLGIILFDFWQKTAPSAVARSEPTYDGHITHDIRSHYDVLSYIVYTPGREAPIQLSAVDERSFM